MIDREKIMLQCKQAIDSGESVTDYSFYYDVLLLLKEQEKTRKFYAEKCDELYSAAKSKVDVVRCKDCNNRECDGRAGTIVCGITGFSHSRLWYCADGERRDGEAK